MATNVLWYVEIVRGPRSGERKFRSWRYVVLAADEKEAERKAREAYGPDSVARLTVREYGSDVVHHGVVMRDNI